MGTRLCLLRAMTAQSETRNAINRDVWRPTRGRSDDGGRDSRHKPAHLGSPRGARRRPASDQVIPATFLVLHQRHSQMVGEPTHYRARWIPRIMSTEDNADSTTTADLIIADITRLGADALHHPITQRRLERIRGTRDYDRVLRLIQAVDFEYHSVHSARPTGA